MGWETNGVFVKVLRYDKETKRVPTFLLKLSQELHIPITIIPKAKRLL